MYNGLKYLFIFSVGAAVGAVATHQILKPKYERMIQDEVNEFKKSWSDRKEETTLIIEGDTESIENEVTTVPELADLASENTAIIESEGYINSEKGGSKSMSDDMPYVISPLKFAEGCDYDTISLTYYSDGVLVDDMGELVEDVAGTVGTEFPEHFGEYTDDPDTVYVRNDRLEADYEIQRDIDAYKDIKQRLLNPTDDE